jgi:hypothetical protein
MPASGRLCCWACTPCAPQICLVAAGTAFEDGSSIPGALLQAAPRATAANRSRDGTAGVLPSPSALRSGSPGWCSHPFAVEQVEAWPLAGARRAGRRRRLRRRPWLPSPRSRHRTRTGRSPGGVHPPSSESGAGGPACLSLRTPTVSATTCSPPRPCSMRPSRHRTTYAEVALQPQTAESQKAAIRTNVRLEWLRA